MLRWCLPSQNKAMERNDFVDQFFEAILTLETVEECYQFFGDTCTPKEIKSIAQRFVVAKMLHEKRVYNDIVEATGASTATISRVNRSLSKGYEVVFSRLGKKNG